MPILYLITCSIYLLIKPSYELPTGKIFIGPKDGNATTEYVFDAKYLGVNFSIPVYAEVFNPDDPTQTIPATHDVEVNCESVEGNVDGYSQFEFKYPVILTTGSSMEGKVVITIAKKGRRVRIRCFGISQASADPQFTKETSYSSIVGVRVTRDNTVSICEPVITVPVESAQENYTSFLVELTEAAEEKVEVTCTHSADIIGEIRLIFPAKVPIAVGKTSALISYTRDKTNTGTNDAAVWCRANNTRQFSASETSETSTFKLDVGTVKLHPETSEINSMSYELLLTVDKPVSDPGGLAFVCGASTFEKFSEAQTEMNNPKCQIQQEPATVPTTTPELTTTIPTTTIESTTSLNDTDNSTTTTMPPTTTTPPTTTVIITTPYIWQVENPAFTIKEKNIHQTLTVMRMQAIPAAVREYVVVACCVPDTSSNIKYKGKIDAVMSLANLQPNVSVDTDKLGSTSERKIENPAFKEYAPCPCDLKKYQCDIGCCCDTVCTENEKKTFSECIAGLEGGLSAELEMYKCPSDHFPKADWFLLTCVQFESNAFLGYFYQNQAVIRSSLEFIRKLQDTGPKFTYRKETTDTNVLLARPDGYTFASILRTQGSGSEGTQRTLNGILTLPQRTPSGDCIRTAPIGYLKEFESSCVIPLTKDLCSEDSVFGARMYVEATTVVIAGCLSGYKVLQGQSETSPLAETTTNFYCLGTNVDKYIGGASTSSVGILQSDYKPAVGNCSDIFGNDICTSGPPSTIPVSSDGPLTRCSWDDGSQKPDSPQFGQDVDKDFCSNTVLEVRYTITWSANKVVLLNSDVIMGQEVPMTDVTQKFSVKFQQKTYAGKEPSIRSGYPGYDVGKPLWNGYVQDVNNFSVDTSSNLQLAVFNTGAAGDCGSVTKRLLNFGEDMRSGCFYSLSLANFTDCDYLRKFVYNKLNEQLLTANYIGRLGYNNITVISEWIEVLRQNISDAFEVNITETEGVINTTNGTLPVTEFTGEGLCKNIPSGINLDVMYGISGMANGVPVNEVIGAYISFTLDDWQFVCSGPLDTACNIGAEVGKPFYLTSSVNFLKVPANTPREPIKYWQNYDASICYQDSCWRELFFPLTDAYEADSFYYSLGFTLLAFLFTIAFFLVTNPMWYTFALLCVTVFFLVFYYVINFWIMIPTYF